MSQEDSASDSSLGAMIVSGLTSSCASNPTPKSLVAIAASTDRFAWYSALLNDGAMYPSLPECSKVRVTISTT